MGAPKGNSFWRQRSKHGRDKLFETPELLWQAAQEYFDSCDSNPWVKTETTVSEKGTYSKEIPTQRPYTRAGMYLYFDCSENWMREFKKTCTFDFLRVIERIENIIDNQQIDGAMVGVFKENLVARLQGVAENNNNNNINQEKPLTKDELNSIDEGI